MKTDGSPAFYILFLIWMNFDEVCFVGFDGLGLVFTVHAGPCVFARVTSPMGRETVGVFESLATLITDVALVLIVSYTVNTQAHQG